jgi:hypothetical protein
MTANYNVMNELKNFYLFPQIYLYPSLDFPKLMRILKVLTESTVSAVL